MSVFALVIIILVSPFMAISLLPALRNRDEEEEEKIVRWRN